MLRGATCFRKGTEDAEGENTVGFENQPKGQRKSGDRKYLLALLNPAELPVICEMRNDSN